MPRRFIVASVCILLCCSPAGALDWNGLHPIGAVTTVTRLDNGVRLGCTGGSSVQLTVLAPDLVRVRTLFPGQAAAPDHSWAIARTERSPPPWQLTEAPDTLTLSTAELRVVVRRDPLRIEFLDAA